MGGIHIGTSGWHYPHWKGPFYPPQLVARRMLGFYAERFATVEINNSFYRLPAAETFARWRDAVSPGFVFAVKASRYLTHMKKLKEAAGALSELLDRAEVLDDRLGPLLFQLPPRWHSNPQRLAAFLEHMPPGFHCAFEFRDPSWFCDEVYQVLCDAGAAFCIFELAGEQSPLVITADWVYVRLHGPAGAYQGSYGDEALAAWAGRIRQWQSEGREVFFFFDNDQAGYAATDALRLNALIASGGTDHG